MSDVNEEFHKERCDYLESIRKLDRENKLLQMMMEKIQPCIKKSCNYSNFDKIKSQAKFDEESGKWILPQLKLEDTQLPNPDEKIRDNGDENYYRKLSRKPDPGQEYFQNRKSNQLLNQRNSPSNINSSQYNSQLGYVSMNNSNLQRLSEHQYDASSYSNDFRAAEVHGQFQLNPDVPTRRGAYRLDAIQTVTKQRKKSSKYTPDNSMNDF